jgi:hypothetical protein
VVRFSNSHVVTTSKDRHADDSFELKLPHWYSHARSLFGYYGEGDWGAARLRSLSVVCVLTAINTLCFSWDFEKCIFTLRS